MKITTYLSVLFILLSNIGFSQSIDADFSQKKMKKDLAVFKEIRLKANSGLYKYRTKEEIDSMYQWADKEIEKSSSHRDFYNVISKLTDYEGSPHNETYLSDKAEQNVRSENQVISLSPLNGLKGNGSSILKTALFL